MIMNATRKLKKKEKKVTKSQLLTVKVIQKKVTIFIQ